MEYLALLQLLPTIKNILAPKQVAPVVEEKKDYTIYYIIGGIAVLIIVALILLINKNK